MQPKEMAVTKHYNTNYTERLRTIMKNHKRGNDLWTDGLKRQITFAYGAVYFR